ncbi:MAG: 1-acyl-sn-glycerol-3-phosphate acyltransferase [Clostridia bacterium]|nr:1-acyl-sn-glycerol-3-phosphate acyltransferase [Clostridia bacterium]
MNTYLLIALIVLGVVIGIPLLFILTLLISSLFISKKKEYSKPSKFYTFMMLTAHKFVSWFSGARIKVSGLEKLPKGRFLMVSNHRSNFDPIITYTVLGKYGLAFISKEANFKIPFVGRLITRLCYLPINREDPRKAITAINKSAGLIKSDAVSMLVYPEGTRSKTCELLPFHDAVFKIAQKAQVPVVVITVKNTEKIRSRFFFRKTIIELDILETFPVDFVKENKTVVLGERAKELMLNNLGK